MRRGSVKIFSRKIMILQRPRVKSNELPEMDTKNAFKELQHCMTIVSFGFFDFYNKMIAEVASEIKGI